MLFWYYSFLLVLVKYKFNGGESEYLLLFILLVGLFAPEAEKKKIMEVKALNIKTMVVFW